MNTLVLYDSRHGNTERLATMIANILRPFGQAEAVRVDTESTIRLAGVDLLILGSPTQGWRPTPAMQSLLAKIPAEQLHGVAIACFDTRFQKSRWLTGSAAAALARQLHKRGVMLLAPPESFFVQGAEGPLTSGEMERAVVWARMLLNRVNSPHAAG
jgi:flavodoxin